MAENPTYPGNPTLPRETQEKILSTFRHSLNLLKSGKSQDCAVGCDFILRMDPRFSPAKQLLEKARNPAAPVDLADLETYVANTLTPMERLGPAASPERLLISAIEAYADRDFDKAVEVASSVLAVLPGNADAKEILEKANRKKGLQPHVENFRQRALFAMEQGQMDEARRNFERMRSLDPEHPEVERLSERILGGSAPGGGVDLSLPASRADDPPFGSEEPDIRFDITSPPGAALPPPPPDFEPAPSFGEPPQASPGPSGLDGLSLDALSLDHLPSPSATVAVPSFSDAGDFSMPIASPASGPAADANPWAPPLPPGPNAEISKLIEEGDDLERHGNLQAAIETWSRVFLSDLSNAEAAARIEKCRGRMAEKSRRVTDALQAGRSLFESRKYELAREKFLEVLALDENEATARSYMQRIEEEMSRASNPHDLSLRSAGGDVLADEDFTADTGAGKADVTAGERPTAPTALKRRIPILPIAGAALVAVIAAGVFLLLRPKTSPPAVPVPKASPIEEARQLFRDGKVDDARATLSRIAPGDPIYQRAQKLLATMGVGATAPGPATAASAPSAIAPPPAAAANAAVLRAQADTAFAEHRFIDALKAYNLCASSYPNDPDFQQKMGTASERVTELAPAVRLFNENDYDSAIPMLWKIFQADHANQDAQGFLVRCYYNQGIISLQNNLFDKAAHAFSEVLGLRPDDVLARRQRDFASRYLHRSPDLLARIYVKYLRART